MTSIPAHAADPHRPRYHFLPPSGWLNDPNGFIYHRGVYHLFYQHNPAGGFHADIHWGHAVSPDLARWQHRPIALAPTPDGPDAGGCWSGSAAIVGGRPVLFYSGVYPQTVCMATGDDDLDTWVKHPTPLIAAPPPGFGGDPADFRDPYVWRAGDTWYMVMGSRVPGGGGAVLLYRSADARAWDYAGPLLIGDPTAREPLWTGTVWECPNLFPLDGRHVLLVSYQEMATGELLYTGYTVGDFDGQWRSAGRPRLLEHGGSMYAPQVTVDEAGQAILIGWLTEARPAAAQRAAGWSGVMSLPRVLSLGDDDTLRFRPAPALAGLRGERFHVQPRTLRPGDANPLAGVRGGGLEIDVTFDPAGATAFGLRLTEAGFPGDVAAVVGDVAAGTVTLRRPWAVGPGRAVAAAAPLPAGPVRLRVFLDRSVVEVFVDDRAVLSGRIYPDAPEALDVALFAEGGAAAVAGEVWAMGDSWE